MQNLPLACPSVLAVLVCCMFTGQFGVTMGVQDKFAHTPQSVLYIGCSDAHERNGVKTLLPLEGISWVRREEKRLLGVHGTLVKNWKSIVHDEAMITKDRSALCFSVYRQGMIVKEMAQQKDKGIFVFIDPVRLIAQGFEVTANVNDVIQVKISGEGLNLRHIMTAVTFNGSPANVPSWNAPGVPEQWKELVTEFTGHIRNPATVRYDDTHGTTGPIAKKNNENAQLLAEE